MTAPRKTDNDFATEALALTLAAIAVSALGLICIVAFLVVAA